MTFWRNRCWRRRFTIVWHGICPLSYEYAHSETDPQQLTRDFLTRIALPSELLGCLREAAETYNVTALKQHIDEIDTVTLIARRWQNLSIIWFYSRTLKPS
ncbi:hypothetical protein HYR99_13075 [Candidatus Poribacteria bacterium]|nr:hypothetical protein [Candidatus Poribacteria bacterium]